jgi:hypothetical protein
MTLTLHLRPEVEASLLAQAQASGMDLEDYVLTVVEEAALTLAPKDTPAQGIDRTEAVRRMLEFGDKHHLSLGEPITRASIHKDHRV